MTQAVPSNPTETNNDLGTDESENKLNAPSADIDKHIQIEGWLNKKSRVLKKWRKRWVVLAGNTIYSYKNERRYDEDPTESIDINHIISIKKQEKSNHHSFDIELSKKLTFTLAADSATYRDLWLVELNKLIDLNSAMLITKESEDGKILSFGCEHFRRNCSYLCSCCNKWYFCSYCHDATESGFINGGHSLERKNIVAMKCCACGKEQPPNQLCIKCKMEMARYFCLDCKFWDNDVKHSLYHCKGCGVCRSGDKRNYVHCEKCGVCLNKTFYESHVCIEQSTKCDCPICQDYLHCTDKPVTFWTGCGHAIHVKCMEEYLVYDTVCPICQQPWKP
eukprot:130323_1